MPATTSEQHAKQLQRSYESLMRVLALLDPAEIEAGRMANNWTPKALIAHVAFWDTVQLQRMRDAYTGAAAEHGYARPAGTNDERAAEDTDRSLDEVLATADAARTALVDFAASLKPEDLARTYPEASGILSLDERLAHMTNHTRTHARELWRYCCSMRRWDRSRLRAFLVRQHTNLMDCIEGLTETTLTTERISGTWTIRDLLTHILSWREFAYHVVGSWPKVDSATIAPWIEGDEDTVNSRLMADRAHLNMIDVADGLTTYHRRLLKHFDAASDEKLASEGDYGWGDQGELAGFFYSLVLHEMEHAEQIWHYKVASTSSVVG